MSIKLPKYADVLSEGKALVEKIKAPFKALQAKKNVEMEILKIEEEQAAISIQLTELYDTTTFNAERVYDLSNKHDLLERKKAFYQTLLTESFS